MLDPSRIPTPSFVLELAALKRNLTTLDEFQKAAGIHLITALKAFTMFRAFPLFRKVTSGAAVSSLNEALLASEFFEELHAYAPVYRDDEFDKLAAMSRHVTFNSLAQFERFQPRLRSATAGLRINPGYSDVENPLYNPCVPGSRLGIPAKALAGGIPSGISGLHVHNLCESGANALALTLQHLEDTVGPYLAEIQWLNLGGGHLITRGDYQQQVAIDALRACSKKYPCLEIIMEPGAAFVWQSGVLVASILDIVDTGGMPVANLDTSFAAHMPDCLEMPYTPAVRGAIINGEGPYRYRLGGCSCLAGDVVGDYAFDAPLSIGQKLIFEDMMHYTMVKTNTFNGIALPEIGIWDKDMYETIVKAGYQDYRKRLS